MQLLGDVFDGRGAAAPPDVERESHAVAGIVGQEAEPHALQRATAAARDPAQLDLHEDPHGSAREVTNPMHPAIVDAAVHTAAHSTGSFFERRTSVTMRTPGSPKIPITVRQGRKPGKGYESEGGRRGLGDRIQQSCNVPDSAQPRREPPPERVSALSVPLFCPLKPPKSQNYKVLLTDLYCLNDACLPMFDVVTLFHLCEFPPENYGRRPLVWHDDASILTLLIQHLNVAGTVLFYAGSRAWREARMIVEDVVQRGDLAMQDQYEGLLVYGKTRR